MIFVSDPDGRHIYVSEEWQDLTSQPVTASLGRGWLSRVHPGDRGVVEDTYRQAIVEASEFSVRFRLLDADDGPRWVLAGGIPGFGPPDDRFVGFLGSLTEIAASERRTGFAHGSVGRFTPPPTRPTDAAGSALDQTADHLIRAHALIEGDGGKNALPSLRRALFEIGRALAARAETRLLPAGVPLAADDGFRDRPEAGTSPRGSPRAGWRLGRIASFERDRFIFRFEPARHPARKDS